MYLKLTKLNTEYCSKYLINSSGQEIVYESSSAGLQASYGARSASLMPMKSSELLSQVGHNTKLLL